MISESYRLIGSLVRKWWPVISLSRHERSCPFDVWRCDARPAPTPPLR